MSVYRATSLLVLLTAFASGCASGPQVRADSDPAANPSSWQGVAQGRLNKTALGNPAAAIDKAVGEIFAKYPVPAAAPAPQ